MLTTREPHALPVQNERLEKNGFTWGVGGGLCLQKNLLGLQWEKNHDMFFFFLKEPTKINRPLWNPLWTTVFGQEFEL